MSKKPVKTAVNDLLDWIDRVEERDIKTLSTEKIRERIKERLPLEKERIIRFANEAVKSDLRSVLFKLYDKKPYDEIIWKMNKPVYSRPFKDGLEIVESEFNENISSI